MKWGPVESRRLTGADLLKTADTPLSFFLRAISDTLPSNTNLTLWKLSEDPTCQLCKDQPAYLRHVLSACKTALSEGRYTWRHNQVLKVLANDIEEAIKLRPPTTRIQSRFIEFRKEGTPPTKDTRGSNTTTEPKGLLHRAADWRLQVDVGDRLVTCNR